MQNEYQAPSPDLSPGDEPLPGQEINPRLSVFSSVRGRLWINVRSSPYAYVGASLAPDEEDVLIDYLLKRRAER